MSERTVFSKWIVALGAACLAGVSVAQGPTTSATTAQTRTSVGELVTEGDRLWKLKRYEEGRAQYEAALRAAPDDPIVQCKYAASLGSGEWERRTELYRRAGARFVERLRAEPARDELRALVLRLAAEEEGGAEPLYEALVSADPNDLDARFELARCVNLGEEAQFEHCDAALRILDGWRATKRADQARARAARELETVHGRWQVALRICNRMLEWNPDDVDALAARAAVHEHTVGDAEDYEQELEQVERLRSADLGRAIAVLDRELASNPRSVPALLKRAEIHPDFEQRIASSAALVEILPNDPAAWFRRAELLRFLSRRDEALRDLSKAIELDPDHVGARMARASLLADRKDRDGQIADLTRVIELGPSTGHAYQSRAYAWRALATERHDFEFNRKALADLVIAMRMPGAERFDAANQFDTLVSELIREFESKREFDEGIELCTSLIELDPSSADLYLRRAELHHAVRRGFEPDPVHEAQAFADLARAIELRPQDERLRDRKWTWYAIDDRRLPEDLDVLTAALEDATLALATDDADAVGWLAKRGRILARLGRSAEALDDLNRAVQLAPGQAWVWATRSRVHGELGHPREQLADLERAIQLAPQDRDLLWARAETLRVRGPDADAIAAYDAFLALVPGDERALESQTAARARLGDWDGIIAALTARIEQDSRAWKLLVERADARAKKGDRTAAIADYTLAVDAAGEREVSALIARHEAYEAWGDSENAFADLNRIVERSSILTDYRSKRARILVRRGQHAEALADYDFLVGPKCRDSDLLRGRAECRVAVGDLDGALADLDLAVESSPGDARAWAERGRLRLLRRDDPERALSDLRRARSIDFDDLTATSALAELYRRRGVEDWRAAELDAWIAEGSASYMAYRERGLRLWDAQDFDGAVADFTAALERAPDCLWCLRYRIAVHMDRRDYLSAVVDADRLIELAPQDPDSWTSRARVQWDRGDREAAMADYQRAVAIAPERSGARTEMESRGAAFRRERAVALNNRAATFFDVNDWKRGIELLDQALQLEPGDERLLCNRAYAVLSSGDHARAKSLFESILEAHPSSSVARSGLASARSAIDAASSPGVVVGAPCFRCGGRGTVTVEHSSLEYYRGRNGIHSTFQWEHKEVDERCSYCLGRGTLGR